MALTPSPFDSDAADGTTHHIIRMKPDGSGKQELVNAHWGTNPRFSDGISYRFVQAEEKTFPSHRCLVPVSDFRMKVGSKHYRVTREDGNFFYLAGVWEPPLGQWPLAFKVITVSANPEVSRYQDRHGAIIERRHAMDWLCATMPEETLLATPPAHVFLVETVGKS
ncbi:putative SOS response-associated peptidase YedK [Sphingobium sp. B11D3B]|uniref:SOS response-associated peptidase family protein n=1 Tax=Sphingobium sp. B11D3B TaxID=2940575 RepID=UPI002227190D|nr:SOS response-associated peptidase family protein [Sphingobium sp. B11D3B]MCW2387143.1 putative SOS response-associated peptidase YedK [Sphingobium sp. B11D3B]